LVVKDVLDSADGQLARSRGTGSRAGRFLDSIGDLLVNVLVFGAIADRLYAGGAPAVIFAVAAAALLCTTVRVSFHAFFQTSYLHLSGQYRNNRITEDIAPEDLSREDPLTLFLHRVFLILYGWQDRLIERIDRWMLGGRELRGPDASAWYGDRIGLRLGGFLGLGTELMVLSLCAVTGSLELYFALNLILLNMVLAAAAGYRLFILAPRIARLFSA
jgi:hypothetical protein